MVGDDDDRALIVISKKWVHQHSDLLRRGFITRELRLSAIMTDEPFGPPYGRQSQRCTQVLVHDEEA